MDAAQITKINGMFDAIIPEWGLSKDVGEYFCDARLWATIPDDPVGAWFALDEQGQKDCVRRRAGERCAITGDKSREVHEIYTRGAYANAALVPWNMEVFSPEIHDHLQNYRMRVDRFDPLDTSPLDTSKKTGCLIVFGLNGKIVPESNVWAYHRESRREAKQDIVRLEQEIKQSRALAWTVADRLRRLKNNGGYSEGGFDDIYQLGASFGLSSARVKECIRASAFAEQSELREIIEAIDMSVVSTLSKVPEDDLVEVLGWFAELPPAEAWERYHVKYPPRGRRRKFLVMKREPYQEVSADSIDEIEHGAEDMVVRGTVIVGIDKEDV